MTELMVIYLCFAATTCFCFWLAVETVRKNAERKLRERKNARQEILSCVVTVVDLVINREEKHECGGGCEKTE